MATGPNPVTVDALARLRIASSANIGYSVIL